MIMFLLGIVDLLAALSFLLYKWDILFFPLFFAIYLIVKGLLFLNSITSIIDIIVGITFIVTMSIGYFGIISWLCIFWLVQKGIVSLFFGF